MTFYEMTANNIEDFTKKESALFLLGFKKTYNGNNLKEYKNGKGAICKIVCNY